jgi:hypothetical protein
VEDGGFTLDSTHVARTPEVNRVKLYHSIPIVAVLALGCGPSRHSGVATMIVSGPIQIETPAAVDAGYAATIAGGRWSIAFTWGSLPIPSRPPAAIASVHFRHGSTRSWKDRI